MAFDRGDSVANPSCNASLAEIIAVRLSRRRFLAGGLVAAGASLLDPTDRLGRTRAAAQSALLGFTGIPVSVSDAVLVPPGYAAEVLFAWGDPISVGPGFKADASNGVEDQMVQAGMHHDGIQTDVSTSALRKGDYAGLGNNQMLAADPVTREVRRFLSGPNGCEITGVVTTPDATSMFVNIQHPGETASERSNPAAAQAVSAWPDGPAGGRPRSATVVIRKVDGGVIGS